MSEVRCRTIVRRRASGPLDTLLCERCGVAGDCSLHHRRKRSQLPKHRLWEPSNCVMLCGDGTSGCHGWVEANPQAAHVEGYHAFSWEEPSVVPVVLWHTGLVFLDDEGGFRPVPA